MKRSILLFAVVTACFSFTAHAQLTGEAVKTQLVKEWERAKAYTGEYLAAMPADRYGSRPVDSIRSFAEQMLHLASGNIGLAAAATGSTRIYAGFNMEKSKGAQSRDSVTYYVNASYDFVINSIKSLGADRLGEAVSFGPNKETRFSVLLKTFEHQTHHRGQCTIYIRLQGIRPPGERLF